MVAAVAIVRKTDCDRVGLLDARLRGIGHLEDVSLFNVRYCDMAGLPTERCFHPESRGRWQCETTDKQRKSHLSSPAYLCHEMENFETEVSLCALDVCSTTPSTALLLSGLHRPLLVELSLLIPSARRLSVILGHSERCREGLPIASWPPSTSTICQSTPELSTNVCCAAAEKVASCNVLIINLRPSSFGSVHKGCETGLSKGWIGCGKCVFANSAAALASTSLKR